MSSSQTQRHSDFGEDTNAHEWAIARIADRAESDPDGKQDEQSAVWTSKQRLKADASKTDLLEREDVNDVVHELGTDGEIVTWHGLIAPATDDHLSAIIESESLSDTPRTTLVGRCNRLIGEGSDQ